MAPDNAPRNALQRVVSEAIANGAEVIVEIPAKRKDQTMPRPNPPQPAGIIEAPGKFEGEPTYVPAAWEIVLNGFGEDTPNHNGHVITRVRSADIPGAWEALKGVAFVELWETEQGFVMSDPFCIHTADTWAIRCDESPNHAGIFKQGPEYVSDNNGEV